MTNDTPRTPLRGRGLRTAEGWVRIRPTDGSYNDGIEDQLTQVFLEEVDLRSTSTDLSRRAVGAAQAFQVDADRANIVRGLAIPEDAVVLEIGAGLGAVTRYLGERAAVVDAVEPAVARARAARARTRDLPGVEVYVAEHEDVPPVPTYDLIVVVGVLEYVGSGTSDPAPYVSFLDHLRKCLKPGGAIALAIENKLGVKYLVGAPEDHTDIAFDGIEGYPGGASVRTFSRSELSSLFTAAGLRSSVLVAFPDYKLTRAVMDTDFLAQEAPDLLRNLPSFPSPDLRSARSRLADEAHVWRSFVDAGLAGEVGNSFLVLASEASQSVWPRELAAVYFSRDRRENYAFEKRVALADDGSLQIRRRRVGRVDPQALFEFADSDEAFVPGPTLLEAAANASLEEVRELLRKWREMLVQQAAGAASAPVDLVPNNIVLSGGGLVAVDQEWSAAGWPVERVLRRGTLWFAAMLLRHTPPSRWQGFETVRDVATALGAAVGLGPDDEWVELALDEEAEFFTEIGRNESDDVTEARRSRRAVLASMVDDRIADLPLGERLPDLFEKVRGYLAVAEQSRDHLRIQLEQARVDEAKLAEMATMLQRAEDERERARAAAADQARRVRTAEAHQVLAAERTAAVERLYGEAASRATAAETALAGVRGSRMFRLVARYYRLVESTAPQGTRRRRAYGSATGTVGRFVRAMRRGAKVEPETLVVPTSDAPTVSIVVPVYGKWEYTERCLRALAETRGGIPFEVLVVDDDSPDDTLSRLRGVQGIRVIPHETNTGYVGACNTGIGAVRGELVVLLNNDTRVDPDWLEPLVRAMDDPTVGLVGSRLVYPDGRLQEAGGIIFSDGSGWNYGKFCEPEDPAFTYRRDVDYCSGASIMLRREVLNSLGGIDDRFAPAYYDDVDLAFGVRRLGLRVVYEPTSVVIHDEGVSHGIDETAGIKSYQVANRLKLQEKWRTELEQQLPADPALVQRAARRRQGRGIVVVIDHYVPRPDEDAGSVRMAAMLRALRSLGYAVLFVPDNRHRSEPYTRRLQDLGVEVLYGPKNLGTVLTELREDLVAIITSRVTVSSNYIVQIRAIAPEVPLFFDTVDLHFLREARAAELEGYVDLPPKAAALRELELAMVRACDGTLVVSTYERELLRSLVPSADIHVLPIVVDRVDEAQCATPAGREGLLFVGSFAHPPNADGLRWFMAEILPTLSLMHPGLRVDVVGRDPMPDLVAAAPAGVVYHGWVEDLTPLYANARVVIAPLRFGAGVKGKVAEAMAHGVPVVMTTVGAEGMAIEAGETALVADEPGSFAESVSSVMRDDAVWDRLSRNGQRHVDDTFGRARFTAELAELLSLPTAMRTAREAGAFQ